MHIYTDIKDTGLDSQLVECGDLACHLFLEMI